ncbi:MAG: hypothetical protein OXS33_00130 [bacterium]|nr:hypothetical protein [bacterium]MDE0500410.1 hypothetical protein [bacterium]
MSTGGGLVVVVVVEGAVVEVGAGVTDTGAAAVVEVGASAGTQAPIRTSPAISPLRSIYPG